ncbi:hypothetical protein EXIGLDRAFT_774289 [Exidia glandulosa HHB12029]|uniref:Uncharacterized protein n=1 Tax=Exidia glandulosa HHB12029 TaxID=1314781 RepID=A0A165EEJ7_EXIGL|nr:hypothetical protein EXIGLDRAFT_774289 [Exidia glandulosa HHB12029]
MSSPQPRPVPMRQLSYNSIGSVDFSNMSEDGEVPEAEVDCDFCGKKHRGECVVKEDKSERWWSDYELAERVKIPLRCLFPMSSGTRTTFRSLALELQFETKLPAVVYAEGMATARFLRRVDLRGAPKGQDLHNTWSDIGQIQHMMFPLLKCEGVRDAVRKELKELEQTRTKLRSQFDGGYYMDEELGMLRREYNPKTERVGGRLVRDILREKDEEMKQLKLEIEMIKQEADKSTKYE